jgi:hypothetical protein
MWWCGEDLVALYTLALLPSSLFFFSLLNPPPLGGKYFFLQKAGFGVLIQYSTHFPFCLNQDFQDLRIYRIEE